MSETKHTPLPWKMATWDYPGQRDLCIQTDKFRLAVLDSDGGKDNPYTIPQEEATANADYIVLACNAHEDLLEACKATIQWADTECMPQDGPYDGPWEMIEAAIAKAEA